MKIVQISRFAMLVAIPAAALYWFRPTASMQAAALDSAADFKAAAAVLPTSAQPTASGAIPFTFSQMDKTVLKDSDTADTPPPEFPREITNLEGKQVAIKGFMVPFQALDDMKSFILMSNQVGCFFCAMPRPTQVCLVRQKESGDDKLPYIDGPISIEGKLKLWKQKSPDDPDLESFLYVIDDAKVAKIDMNPALVSIQ